MSFFGKVFGGGKGKPVSQQDAITRLRETEEMLEKKSAFLEKKIDEHLQQAKQYAPKNKRMALATLKKKKKFEKQLMQIDNTLSNVEMQREALENAKTNTEIIRTMQYGAKALSKAHGELTADDIHDMMDDIQEQQEVSNEISDALSTPAAYGGMDYDEDELMAELEELEQEELDKEMLNIPATDLPEVPANEPVATKKKAVVEEDHELKELESWLS